MKDYKLRDLRAPHTFLLMSFLFVCQKKAILQHKVEFHFVVSDKIKKNMRWVRATRTFK